MEEQNVKKIKLLKLVEILRAETDEQNPMLATDVCKRLADNGIIVHRRVLTRDIDILNEFGIKECYFGHIHGCYNIPEKSEYRGISLRLISADYINFIPKLI